MKRICVVPRWNGHRGNRLFGLGETDAKDLSCYNNQCYSFWRRLAEKKGYLLDTDDVSSLEEADGIWLLDLPRKRSEFDRILNTKRSTAKVVLQVCESPLIVPQSHEKSHQLECDLVMTYEKPKVDDARSFHYEIPTDLELEGEGISFGERRCAMMINSNKQEGWMGSGIVGSTRFPGWGKYFNGWTAARGHRLFPARGELYSWRRKFARTAERMDRRSLDIYGLGWTGEPTTWIPVKRPEPYLCATGDVLVDRSKIENFEDKISLIGHYRFGVAVENFRGSTGYISEKIFDVIRAGSVPIYLGDESIGEVLPAGAFVDVRQFGRHEELLHYLAQCPESEWAAMRTLGRTFLKSGHLAQFGMEAFAKTAMEVLGKL